MINEKIDKNNLAEVLGLDVNILDARIDFIKTKNGFETGIIFYGKITCVCGEEIETFFKITENEFKKMIKLCNEV